MADNLSLILNKYDLISLFVTENDEFKNVSSDNAKFTEKQMKQSMVVLKQTLSALQGIKFKKMVLRGNGIVSVFIRDSEKIIGYVAKGELEDGKIIESLKAAVVEKGPELTPEVEKKQEEVAVEEKKEEVIEEKDFDAPVLNDINKIAEEYLEDFAYEILENVKSDIGMKDSDKYSSTLLLKYIGGLEQSASMLIGPTRAEEMKDKMKKLLV
ncbi:hypothetical protein J7J58_05565 [candidate division WOR-3 bacterium]|uniref:Uncharacterized protein n=1 Tax=candidate division TA06 bacterium TaxID=2250710 RepID=A0A660S8Q6_UNCT6|nr:hypothetical protein [candidate division WOR-3 bacterium]RKX65440.1 MAG: hypothetical protein DRP44_06355 [candidate division TA06 bacterium]